MGDVVPISTDAKGRVALPEIGSTGLKHGNGILEEEFLRELRGLKGVKTFREMSRNDAVVGASLFAYVTLACEVKFQVESAKPGDKKADEVRDFVQQCLFDDMSISWRELISQILTFMTYGWSFFEVVYKRRGGETNDPRTHSKYTDNKIGWRKWAVRGQETLDSWVIDDHGETTAFVQKAWPLMQRVEIPMSKGLLFKTPSENNSPEGISILRTAYLSWYYKRRLQILRGIGMERDLAGMPMLTPPQGVNIWNENDAAATRLKSLAEQLVRNIRRDEHEGIVKPFGWEFELVSTSGSRQFDITSVIAQLNQEIAMSVMTDFLLVGHEKVGARSLSIDKRETFAHAAASFLDIVCDVINRFAIPQLVRLNGWTADLCPKLGHGPVAEVSLTELTQFVTNLTNAGVIFPDQQLEEHLRRRAYLPPPPEDSEEKRLEMTEKKNAPRTPEPTKEPPVEE